jgi:hypothetical protein
MESMGLSVIRSVKREKSLIAYIIAGDPSLEDAENYVLLTSARAGSI